MACHFQSNCRPATRMIASFSCRQWSQSRICGRHCAAHVRRREPVWAPASLALPTWLWFLGTPAIAQDITPNFGAGGNADPKSYWTVLVLFLISVPGLWSQVKRAPKAKIKRKTFEVTGPKAEVDAMTMDERARQLFGYMKRYNYDVKSTGETITFSGNYRSMRGQAAAITFYMFCGMLCCGLVFSIALPGGSAWYSLVLLTPLAPWYYYKNADREEEFSIKMIESDNEQTVDVVVQGDDEEIERMTRELGLQQKGMVYVPGLLEGVMQQKQ